MRSWNKSAIRSGSAGWKSAMEVQRCSMEECNEMEGSTDEN